MKIKIKIWWIFSMEIIKQKLKCKERNTVLVIVELIYTVKRLHWDRLWIIFIFFALTLSYLNVENSLKECKEWQVSLKINSLKMRHEMSSKEFNLIDKIYEKSTVDIMSVFCQAKVAWES